MVDDTSAEDGFAGSANRTREDAPDRVHASPQDREFFFRTVAALSAADIGLHVCLERIRDGLSLAIEGDVGLRRRKTIADALAKARPETGVQDDPFLFAVFEANGFLLSASERCALSIRLSEASPRAVVAAANAAAGFASEIGSR